MIEKDQSLWPDSERGKPLKLGDEGVRLGHGAISEGLYEFIQSHLPVGSTILEFGSGHGSAFLAQHYDVHSVEHDKKWLDRYDTVNYIYGPIKTHKPLGNVTGHRWYDWHLIYPDIAKVDYNLIIVDGPPATFGRAGFLKYIDHFPKKTPIIFDDVNRGIELKVATKVAARWKEPLTIYDIHTEKHFGVIGYHPDSQLGR